MKYYSNLCGDFQCPFQIFFDVFFNQKELQDSLQLFLSPICKLETTNDWINLEALGKPQALRAKQLLDIFISKQNINEKISLNIKLDKAYLSSDNLYSLLLLDEKIPLIEFNFFSNLENIDEIKAQLKNKKPNTKINFNNIDAVEYEIIENFTKNLNHRNLFLTKCSFNFSKTFFQEKQMPYEYIQKLIGYAWVCLKAGAAQPATDMLEKALTCFDLASKVYDLLFMQLQIIRFLSHQYLKVCNASFENKTQTLSDADADSIYFLKAYAATMSRNLEIADESFEKCKVNAKMQLDGINSLYRLNLFALSQVLKGKIDVAFNLESRIEKYIDENKIDEIGLKYVNFINTARLYKKAKDFDKSKLYYDKAYSEISSGGYTQSDFVYYNMNLGSLYEAKNDNQLALMHWLNAAIHWVAYDNKFALAWRPRIILCGEKLTDILNPLNINKASKFLLDKITSLAENLDLQIKPSEKAIKFVCEKQYNSNKKTCYIFENIVLYSCKQLSIETPLKEYTFLEKLEKLLSGFVTQNLNLKEEVDALYLDVRLENTYPASESQAMALTYFSGCDSCVYNGKDISTSLDKSNDYKDLISLNISNNILSLDKSKSVLSVNNKRSFLNKVISDASEAQLVNEFYEHKKFKFNDISSKSGNAWQSLLNKGILFAELSEG